MPTALAQLLDPTPKAQFVREHFHRLPDSRQGTAEPFCRLGTWERLVAMLSDPAADALVVRQGERNDEQLPLSPQRAENLRDEGYTILLRHAQRHCAELKRLAGDFARDFHAPVNVHFYATPGGDWGFPWHYDAEEVFIVQTAGRKEYRLRKNTVNPWPLEETLPADMQYEREIMPLMRVELAAGDWLYIPSGWWHQAQTIGEETALSLAIGVMPRTGIDVLDFLRDELCESMLWRQRVGGIGEVVGDEVDLESADEVIRQVLTMLADDLNKRIAQPDFIDRLLRHFASVAAVAEED